MKFAYWSREIAGWILILAGLWCFKEAYVLLLNKRIIEAGPLTFIGFFVFRGGLHILKVAVAAQAALSLPDSAPSTARRVTRAPTRPVGPTAPSTVLPGPKNPRGATGGRG